MEITHPQIKKKRRPEGRLMLGGFL